MMLRFVCAATLLCTAVNGQFYWNVVASVDLPSSVLGAGEGAVGLTAGTKLNELVVLGRDSLAVIAINWSQHGKTFTVKHDSSQHGVLEPSVDKGFASLGAGDISNATGDVTLFTALMPAVSNEDGNCSFGAFSQLSGNWTPTVVLTTAVPNCEYVTAVNGPAIGLPSPFLVSSAADNVTALTQFLLPAPTGNQYTSAETRTLPLRRFGPTGIHGVADCKLHNGLAYIVADSSRNEQGSDFFVYDMMAVFHAEQPFAPLMSYMSVTNSSGGTKLVGIAMDAAGVNLWVIANSADGRIRLFALESQQ